MQRPILNFRRFTVSIVWNALPSTANFASLNAFLGIALKRLISLVFLVCNIFICVIEYAPSDYFLLNVLGQLLVFRSDLAVPLF